MEMGGAPPLHLEEELEEPGAIAVGEEQDVEVLGVQAGLRRDDPTAGVVACAADDGEGRGVADTVDFDLEPRELVLEELRERGPEDPGAPEMALERQVHLTHDAGVDPAAGPEKEGPAVAAAEPDAARPAVGEDGLRAGEIERYAELEREDVRRARGDDAERDLRADESAHGFRDRAVPSADRHEVEASRKKRLHDPGRVAGPARPRLEELDPAPAQTVDERAHLAAHVPLPRGRVVDQKAAFHVSRPLEEFPIPLRRRNPQMPVRRRGGDAPAGRALQEAGLKEIGLVEVLESAAV